MQHQDEDLGDLEMSVLRLGNMAGAINDELIQQNKMLTKLDEDVDDAGNRLNFVTAQLSKLLKTKDGCQLWTVVILLLVLIVLGNNCTLLYDDL